MRVFFDGQSFSAKAYGGGGRLFLELIRHLNRLSECEVDWFAGAYRTPLPVAEVAKDCHRFRGFRCPPLSKLRAVLDPLIWRLGQWSLDHSGADIYHPTYYSPYHAGNSRWEVVTIYDLNHERYPQHYPGNATVTNRKLALDRADRVVCISHATRVQLLEIYPHVAGKTEVIQLASSLSVPKQVELPPSGRRPFFLYVGNRNAYKNFRVMVAACRAIPRFAERYSLLCYGGNPFTDEERRELAEAGLQGCVEQSAGNDEALAALYHHAICFIYPSTEEGFGIPLLEAMNCGCAVLASRIPVFEEVAGNGAAYFDPNSGEELAALMQGVADNPAWKLALVQAGTERAKLYSWERCARQHLELYRKIVGN